jgi:26S proteasome regulatory subunit N2
MRNAGIDVEFAKKKGIIVSGTGNGGNSTLEHIWALILSVARNISADDANVKGGNPLWQTNIPMGLSGKTLGLVGVGRLGSQTAKVLFCFLDKSSQD